VSKDPHRNLFHYFRGPLSRGKKIEREIQLEDNITKSLINILEFSDRDKLGAFLTEICKIKIQAPLEDMKFVLHRKIPEDTLKQMNQFKVKKLIAITTSVLDHKEIHIPPEEEKIYVKLERIKYPDAWIYSIKKKFVVLFENKIRGPLYQLQINKYSELIQLKRNKDNYIKKTWSEIYN